MEKTEKFRLETHIVCDPRSSKSSFIFLTCTIMFGSRLVSIISYNGLHVIKYSKLRLTRFEESFIIFSRILPLHKQQKLWG